MKRIDQAQRQMALDESLGRGVPDGYRELEEGEYANDDCWYLDWNGGVRKGDLRDLKGGFRYNKKKHQVIIRPTEKVLA